MSVQMTVPADPVDVIFDILASKGDADYGGECVSQLQHALQCAMLAEQAGASSPLIAAALLHDIGHLIDDRAHQMRDSGVDARHEAQAER